MTVLNTGYSVCYAFWLNWNENQTWQQAREKTQSTGVYTDRSCRGSVGSTYDNPYRFQIERSVMSFDTSSIPANATITSAVLHWRRVREVNQQNSTPNLYICPVSATGNNSGYYNQTYFGTVIATIANTIVYKSGGGNVNTYVDVSLPTANIIKAGTTLLGVRMGHDYLGNADAPGNHDNSINYMENEANGLGNPTTLIVTWTTPPAVTTGVASALQPISATLAGNVTDAGGGTVSERGVCWSTSANPTTTNPKATSAGSTGAYTVSATGLLPGTLYHFRSYVITENSTQYGADATFRTPGGAILFNLL